MINDAPSYVYTQHETETYFHAIGYTVAHYNSVIRKPKNGEALCGDRLFGEQITNFPAKNRIVRAYGCTPLGPYPTQEDADNIAAKKEEGREANYELWARTGSTWAFLGYVEDFTERYPFREFLIMELPNRQKVIPGFKLLDRIRKASNNANS